MIETLKAVSPIIVVLITVIGGGYFKFYFDKKTKEIDLLKDDKKKLETKVKDNSIFVQFIFSQSKKIEELMQDILKNTRATRVHLFSASNGKEELKYTNSLVGFNIVNGKIERSKETYEALEYDTEYSFFLKRVEANKREVLNIPVMLNSMLKTIYKSIGIRHSIVSFNIRCEIDKENDRIFYTSSATTELEEFTEMEMFYIKKKNDEINACLKEILNINK